MNAPAVQTPVQLISTNTKLETDVANRLTESKDYRFLGKLAYDDSTVKSLLTNRPDIVLIDCADENAQYLQIIDTIATGYPEAAIVAVVPGSQIHMADQVILAGARAILLYPFSEQNVVETLRRIQELIERTATRVTESNAEIVETKGGKAVVVFSPKGGVGCSTIAVNLAISIHQETKEKVLVIDGKKALGHISLMLNIRTANTIADLTNISHKLDPELITQVVVNHPSGISVLASPTNISRGNEIHPEELFNVISTLMKLYPNIVIDGGNYLDNNLVTYMDMADHILLVVEANIAALRDARQFLELCDMLSYTKGKVLIVLNKSGSKTEIKINEIEKSLQAKIFSTIPNDQDITATCLNDGIPILLKNKNHPISKAIKRTAKSLIDLMEEEILHRTMRGENHGEMLRRSSYLG